jgi:hypothetical protein
MDLEPSSRCGTNPEKQTNIVIAVHRGVDEEGKVEGVWEAREVV